MRSPAQSAEPLRPALLPPAAENDFRELLGFRHFARHGYDVEPEPARMLEHGDRVARCQVMLTASMAELVVRLRAAGSLAEVEDFVEFLALEAEEQRATAALAKLSEQAFSKVWDNPDDAEYDKL